MLVMFITVCYYAAQVTSKLWLFKTLFYLKPLYGMSPQDRILEHTHVVDQKDFREFECAMVVEAR